MTKSISETLADLQPYIGLTDTNVGEMLVYKNDTIVSGALALYGEYSYAELEIISKWLDSSSLHLDIGTNVGYHALAIHKLVGCDVMGFEPQPNHFAIAAFNTRDKNIQLSMTAVGNITSTIRISNFLPDEKENYGEIHITDDVDGIEVPIITIDDLNLDRCSSMKIDVEGFELNVLEGANNTIDKFRPIIQYEATEFEKDNEMWRKCHAFLEAKDYKQYWVACRVKPEGRENFKNSEDNPYGHVTVSNILAIPVEYGQPDFLYPATREENYVELFYRISKYKIRF